MPNKTKEKMGTFGEERLHIQIGTQVKGSSGSGGDWWG